MTQHGLEKFESSPRSLRNGRVRCISPRYITCYLLHDVFQDEGDHNSQLSIFTSSPFSYCRLQHSICLTIPTYNSYVAIVPSTAAQHLPSVKYINGGSPIPSLFLQLSHILLTHKYYHIISPQWHFSSSPPSSLFWGGSLASMISFRLPLRSLRLVRIPHHLRLPLHLRPLLRLVR